MSQSTNSPAMVEFELLSNLVYEGGSGDLLSVF